MTKLFALILLAAMTLLAAIVLVARSPGSPFVSGAHAQTQSAARVSLHIDGMTCASCAAAVRTALLRLDGVSDAIVSFDDKRARVAYDPNRVMAERMVQAVNDLGYHARIERES
ncbi:MAG: heavy-metal-associated domain-containing protein [Deltaproteobacteria bacterium]|nr:heavy-metal-associated domain-containing protein [Deltaproteobacteria bacterium]